MTWLEILDVLEKMPVWLLKKEATVWLYDDMHEYETYTLHNLVSPIDGDENPDEWTKDSGHELSFQSYESDDDDEVRKERFRRAMDKVCGECGNTCGSKCDECFVRKTWRLINRPKETDKTYTCTFTREQMRESAEALGHYLTDEMCDRLAGYAAFDVVDEQRLEHYFSYGMQNEQEVFVLGFTGIYNIGRRKEADMPRQLTELQRGDFNWFKFKMPELYAEHGHCHAVISNKRVLGTYPTHGDAVRAALEQADYGEFIVQEVGPDKSAYTAEFTSMWVLA